MLAGFFQQRIRAKPKRKIKMRLRIFSKIERRHPISLNSLLPLAVYARVNRNGICFTGNRRADMSRRLLFR